MLQTGTNLSRRNRPSLGRPWPSLCSAPPHQYDTGQGLLVSPELYARTEVQLHVFEPGLNVRYHG
ncbi:hypothetical protein T12_5326 [Trichinella patagoniensis]|uniref:Uncharacterized protein n=1 Tax=Trichinella patagoniensis TaxID=990121 RepID=A0A0V0Z6I3_9BILA|nr:hypothetical protein T12_5326 [Trichinella patagoniensis]